ncbi:MAG: response regulator transcription factor [Burkholderiales bacterium]|nr:response regulator transcription factor [Burkholderiales bacterium]
MRIMIIDDHPLTCAGLASLLASAHVSALIEKVHTAEAARAALLGQNEVDWLFLDIHLPDDPELRLFNWIRETSWAAKTVLISAEMDGNLLSDALASGMRGFIPKSADPELVLEGFDAIRLGAVFLPPQFSRLEKNTSGDAARKPLSPRQQEVLGYLLQGSPNKVIARELDLALHTVKEYVSAIFKIYGVSNRLELLLKLGAKRGAASDQDA